MAISALEKVWRMSIWATQFESIGDNCELGFVQRRKGFDQGSLLKWCRIMSHKDLICFLNAPQDQFYLRENLVPAWNDMITDQSSGIQYHTTLHSQKTDAGRHFIDSGDAFNKKYKSDFEKKTYMYNKLFTELRKGEKVYVYKMNGKNDISMAEEILSSLRMLNDRNRLLYVTDQVPAKAGTVERVGENLFHGFIQQFAPYNPVAATKLEYWEVMFDEAVKVIYD